MAALILGAAVTANAAIIPAKTTTVKEVKAGKHPKQRKAKKVKKAAAETTTAQKAK